MASGQQPARSQRKDRQGNAALGRRATTPQMRGRYLSQDVLARSGHWDPVTRAAVFERVTRVPEIRFFTEREARTLRAFCDVVTAQDREPRIPVLEMIDARLHAGQLDGFRYDDLPPDPETWRRVAAHLDQTAAALGAPAGFAGAPETLRHEIVRRFAQGELEWEIPAARAWSVVTRWIVSAFYAHPWAWNEIGFGGPAYPDGYARLGPGQREHWESEAAFDPDPVKRSPGESPEANGEDAP